jgi:hypothetical protein
MLSIQVDEVKLVILNETGKYRWIIIIFSTVGWPGRPSRAGLLSDLLPAFNTGSRLRLYSCRLPLMRKGPHLQHEAHGP